MAITARNAEERRQADIREPSRILSHGLYAVAIERIDQQGRVTPAIEYLHAEDVSHARAQFCYSEPNRRTSRIVGVALVIGFYVNENHGDKLSVD